MSDTPMPHPAPVSTEVKLNVTDTLMLDATVMAVVFNTVDSSYHYTLQTIMTDGNNSATVEVGDVVQQLVLLPNI